MKFIPILIFMISCHVAEKKYTKVNPVALEKINEQISKLTLTEAAEKRLGIGTVSIIPVNGVAAVPDSSLVYDSEGRLWLFSKDGDHSYHREEVTLISIDRETARVRIGRTDLLQVVTAGSAELFGAEAGVGK